MGGCYSSSYGYSSCSVPAWQTNLKDALKSGERSALALAYADFFQKNERGFIAEAAKILEIPKVENIPKEFSKIEYEVKFDIQLENGKGKEPPLEKFLDTFDFPAARTARFLKDPVHSVATGVNRFYGTENDEKLVVITKGGGTFLKEKGCVESLDVGVPFQELVIKRTEARYPVEIDDVISKILEVSAQKDVAYRGKIRKEKGDDFVLDISDGRIYSFTITRAHLMLPQEEESSVQRQVELEYAGYLPGFKSFEKDSEKQIVGGILDLARYTYGLYREAPIQNGWKLTLTPTHERKFDFIVDEFAVQTKRLPSLEQTLLLTQ